MSDYNKNILLLLLKEYKLKADTCDIKLESILNNNLISFEEKYNLIDKIVEESSNLYLKSQYVSQILSSYIKSNNKSDIDVYEEKEKNVNISSVENK